MPFRLLCAAGHATSARGAAGGRRARRGRGEPRGGRSGGAGRGSLENVTEAARGEKSWRRISYTEKGQGRVLACVVSVVGPTRASRPAGSSQTHRLTREVGVPVARRKEVLTKKQKLFLGSWCGKSPRRSARPGACPGAAACSAGLWWGAARRSARLRHGAACAAGERARGFAPRRLVYNLPCLPRLMRVPTIRSCDAIKRAALRAERVHDAARARQRRGQHVFGPAVDDALNFLGSPLQEYAMQIVCFGTW